MLKNNSYFLFAIGCFISNMVFNSCFTQNKSKLVIDKTNYEIKNKTDSVYIIFTVKEYSRQNKFLFQTSSMYKINEEEINYFVERIFYSPDKNKCVAWVGEKMYNAPTIEKYNNDEKTNRMCPLGGDTVVHFSVLAGYRNIHTGLWNLYQWGNRQVPCSNTVEIGLKELEEYYFKNIKEDYFEIVGQEGKSKGIIKKQTFTFALNEKEFWDTPLWQIDSVGADNRHPFEGIYYRVLTDTCFKCMELTKLPKIIYPDSILHPK